MSEDLENTPEYPEILTQKKTLEVVTINQNIAEITFTDHEEAVDESPSFRNLQNDL